MWVTVYNCLVYQQVSPKYSLYLYIHVFISFCLLIEAGVRGRAACHG